MKKRYDPLWEIVGEKVGLQGEEVAREVPCPRCKVVLGVSLEVGTGTLLCCGLCGATCKVVNVSSEAGVTVEEVKK